MASPPPTPGHLSYLDAEGKMTAVPTEGKPAGLQGSGQRGAGQRPSPWSASTLQPQKGPHWATPAQEERDGHHQASQQDWRPQGGEKTPGFKPSLWEERSPPTVSKKRSRAEVTEGFCGLGRGTAFLGSQNQHGSDQHVLCLLPPNPHLVPSRAPGTPSKR